MIKNSIHFTVISIKHLNVKNVSSKITSIIFSPHIGKHHPNTATLSVLVFAVKQPTELSEEFANLKT
jgi:hypothetical protein